MPAKTFDNKDKKLNFIHIYNCGVEERTIFKDDEDYVVFESYLKDYLSPLVDSEKTKKTFVVNGHTYRGTPHLPKNYLGKIELVAYSLTKDHFHLLIKEIVKGFQVNFLRSLCTRYSIYFNKKYKHRGGVFDGPYKSIAIEDLSLLPSLSRYINAHSDHSSLKEYLGERTTSWIKPETILSKIDNYKSFVKDQDSVGDENLLSDIILEKKIKTTPFATEISKDFTEAINIPTEIFDSYLPIHRRVPEMLVIGVTFLALLSVGIKNINASPVKSSVLSARVSPTPASLPTVAKQIPLIIVKIDDGSETVAIRKSSSFNAQKIAEAHEGEKFEFLSFDNDWYKIRLSDNSVGFIYSKYISKKGGN